VLFLFPPTRVLLRALLVRRGALKLMGSMPMTANPPNGRFRYPDDVESTAVDIDQDRLDPPR